MGGTRKEQADHNPTGETVTGNGTTSGSETDTGSEGTDTGTETGSENNQSTSGTEAETGSEDDSLVHITISGEPEIESNEQEPETVTEDGSQANSIKWPVIWGVSGLVVLIIGLVIYASMRRPLY